MRETAEVVASYWEAIGIRTKPIGEEYVAWHARFKAAKGPDGEFVGLLNTTRAGTPDPSWALGLVFSGNSPGGAYYNPELDKLIVQARATVDDTKRAEVIKKAVKIIHEDVATIPIYNHISVFAMKKNIDFKPMQKNNFDLILIKDVTVN